MSKTGTCSINDLSKTKGKTIKEVKIFLFNQEEEINQN
jgi:hypothetical protein